MIIGQLLFDLGNISALDIDVESAIECYELAEKYGFESLILNERKSHLTALIRKANYNNGFRIWAERNVPIMYFLAILILITLSYLLYLATKKVIDFLLRNK